MATWFYFGNQQKREFLACPLCRAKGDCLYSSKYCHALLLAYKVSYEWQNDYLCLLNDNYDFPDDWINKGWTDITMETMQHIDYELDDAHKELIEKYRQGKKDVQAPLLPE